MMPEKKTPSTVDFDHRKVLKNFYLKMGLPLPEKVFFLTGIRGDNWTVYLSSIVFAFMIFVSYSTAKH